MAEAGRIELRVGGNLDLDEVIDVYRASGLAERRPAEDRRRMALMLASANLIVSAWEAGAMVGIARSLTDHTYVTYLSDLAVRASHQRTGVGRALIERTRRECEPGARLVLLAAPAAVDYYARLGFERHPSAWMLLGTDRLTPGPG